MKAITVWQPWATLIALRLKGFETRGRRTYHHGPLAIHAGLKVDREACEREPIKSVLAEHGYTVDNLPTGAVVATAELRECFLVKRDYLGGVVILDSDSRKTHFSTSDDEFQFGDFTPGRYAWEMADVKMLTKPIPAKGQQGLWNWEPGEGGKR